MIDITGDGKFLLVVEWDAEVRIYKNTNNQFIEYYPVITPPDNSSSTYTGAISDDHEWVVFSSYDYTNTFVYKLENGTYSLNQTIVTSYIVSQLAMTPDHSFLVLIFGSQAYVYKHNGIQFDTSTPQIINYPTYYSKFVSITNDHQYLTVSDWSS